MGPLVSSTSTPRSCRSVPTGGGAGWTAGMDHSQAGWTGGPLTPTRRGAGRSARHPGREGLLEDVGAEAVGPAGEVAVQAVAAGMVGHLEAQRRTSPSASSGVNRSWIGSPLLAASAAIRV